MQWALEMEYRSLLNGENPPAPTKRHPIKSLVPLTPTEKHVLTVLAWKSNGKDEFGAWPSQATLAKLTGLDVRTVRAALRMLDGGKVITARLRTGTKRNAYEYRLNMSEAESEPTV